MLAWYASSPEHAGTADLSLASNPQPPTSPAHHFGRPAMQSPGPPYQGSMGSAMNYSERPYENQMVSHCQTNSYPSYQPPSPYRPHPVSPPAHAHQYGAHSNHQMHSSLAYGAGHQLSPYGSSQAHYASLGTDIYGSRASMYSNSSRAMQQMKSSWGDSNGNGGATDLMQYSQPSPRPPMMPPPPIHSPSHGGMSSSVPPPPPPHYRQIPIVSPASHSPHSWSQSQIPSPGVLHPPHSPRTTPSPLPAHTRSPSHSQPFSPPPSSAAPSPHQPPPSMTPHPPPQKTTPSPPSGSATPAPGPPRQPICNSPSTQSGSGGSGGNNDPLQSLQKMVMLDSETVESPITRANYEMAANQAAAAAAAAAAVAAGPTGQPGGPPPVSSNRPSSYFSVEQLAGSDPGSPYPTYYNLDQNRLCTPPRTCMSTPTSSTFSSAPDSTSSNSPRSDSRTTTASADSSNVGHVNGDIQQQQQPQQQQQSQEPQQQPRQQTQQRRPDFPPFDVSDVRIPNGTHPTVENTGREENGPASSDSENKDTQDFLHHLGGNVPDIPPTDGTVDLSNSGRKSPKSPVDARRAYGDDIHCDPSLLDSPMDAISRSKPLLMPPDRRNSTLPEFEITNGKPEGPMEDLYPTDGGYVPRPPRYYSPTARWNKMGPLEDGFMGMQNKTYQEDYMPMPKAKRGRKKKMFAEHEGLVSEWDIYNTEITHRPARVSRGGTRGRRGSRRRGGLNAYPPPNPEPNPMDMYSNDLLSMRNHHPTNGMADMMGSGGPDKNMPWSSHNYHMGPPQSMTPEYCPKDTMSVIKPPMMDPHGMDGSSMNSGSMASSQTAQNYQSDVPPVEGRGPLLFTVNKDGSTVKLQDGQMSNNNNSNVQSVNQQYYDPVLGQMVQQPMKKKRGRPFGSKNKPKPPGEEGQPRRRRKKEIFFGPEGPPPPHPKPRIINGPYVRISGIKSRALTVSVINVPPKDDDMETKYLLQKRQLQQLGNTVRQKLGLGPSNSNSPLYEMVSKDKSWLCCLCCKNSHYRGLGDLFGPYYLNGEQKPSVISAPPSPVPPPPPQDPASPSVNSFSYGQESNNSHLELHSKEEEPDQEDSRDSTLDPQRRFPGKRRSDVMEQMFRAALLRKAKQANVSLTGQKACEGLQMGIYNPTEFPTTMPPMYPQPQLQLEPCEDVKGFWVHEECATWSKGVYLFSQKVYGLEETIIEAAETICSRCKFPGASLTCAWHKCTEHYHYMCARNKWCQMNEDDYTILCPKHQELIK